ncbi:MAG: hypothetical protein ACRDKS_14605 [Actinomycetota bacterium]
MRIGVGPTVLILFFLAQLMTAATASAAAPSSYGWWSQASLGASGSPIAPDVPTDGLFVQNLVDSPIALSALTFSVPSGASAGALTLHVSGTGLIAEPPIACIATSAFEPAQGGPWSDQPNYDCSDFVLGVVSADMKQVAFSVYGLITSQKSSVVILAGGPADRIAFEKPDLDALTINSAAVFPPPSFDSGPVPPLPPFPVPAPVPQLNPVPQPSAGQGSALGAPIQKIPGASVAAVDLGSTRRRVGTTLGVVLLLLSILYWSDGFGLVPLRSSVVARIRRKPA